jgi:hypothetical protein
MLLRIVTLLHKEDSKKLTCKDIFIRFKFFFCVLMNDSKKRLWFKETLLTLLQLLILGTKMHT